MTEYVTGYDDYEKDFLNLALPEFGSHAENKLLEAWEDYVGESTITVYLPASASKNDISYTFTFDIVKGRSMRKGDVAIYYTGYF